jgi:hypothetical protein
MFYSLPTLSFVSPHCQTYNEIRESQETYYSENHKEYAANLKKIAYAQMKKGQLAESLKTLGELEEIQEHIYGLDSKQVEETERLMSLINYLDMKYPGFMCFNCGDDDDVATYGWRPKMPNNGSKMSGHRVTYA